LAKQNELDALIEQALNENDPRGKMILREVIPEEVSEIKRQGGPDVSGMEHEITAEELRHALKRHGQIDEATRRPTQRTLTKEDLGQIAAIIDAPSSIKVQLRGKNKTSIIYGRNFEKGKVEYIERIFETSNKNKPRLSTKTVWVNIAATGVESSPATVYTPYRNISILFSDGRVKPSDVNVAEELRGVALVGQSTMSGAEYQHAAEKLRAELRGQPLIVADTVCPEAEKRQDAVRDLCEATGEQRINGMLVVGGKDSANTRRLFELAKESGVDAELIQGPDSIPERFFRMPRIGLSAGASTPDEIVDAVEKVLRRGTF
jgi:hypothetical protein